MMFSLNKIWTLILFFALLLCSCSKEVAGTATQTENTIANGEVTGIVYHKNGSTASGVVVRLVENFKTELPEYRETVSDSLGVFTFKDVFTDSVMVLAVDKSANEIQVITQETISTDSLELYLDKGYIVQGFLTYNDSSLNSISVGSHFKVYVPQLPIFESVFAPSDFSLLIPESTSILGYMPGDPIIVEILEQLGVEDSLIYKHQTIKKANLLKDTLFIDTLIWGMWNSLKDSNFIDTISIREPADSNTIQNPIDSSVTEIPTDSIKADTISPVGYISGKITCEGGPCEDIEVMLITDIFGFNFTSGTQMEFKVDARTDSLGQWILPKPTEIPFDSFRVEYRKKLEDSVMYSGVSRYIQSSEIENLTDTLFVENATLFKTSYLSVGVRLVIDLESSQSENCLMNSVVLGLEGTSHFIRAVTCNVQVLENLPSGIQRLLLYSGEQVVISALQDAGVEMSQYVSFTDLVLNEGNGIKELWLTYTPPTLK